jgi:nitroreductase/NAD-dependent dihydropyrimidine dehydrogenase PreA subunit
MGGDMLKEFIKRGKGDLPKSPLVPPFIITEKCTGCGLCAQTCFCFVLEMQGGKAALSNKKVLPCCNCGHCISVCPAGALVDSGAETDGYPDFNPKSLPSARALQTLFRSRRSVRRYKNKPVSREVIERILDAGRYAPTGGNRQDVGYIVIDSREKIQRLSDMTLSFTLKYFSLLENKALAKIGTLMIGEEAIEVPLNYLPVIRSFKELRREGEDRVLYHAPVLILVHANKWDDIAGFGCVAALYQASLMAHILGLGCCFNGFVQIAAYRERKMKDWLGIPWNHKCYGAMTIGYPAMKFKRMVSRQGAKVRWIG